MGKTSVLPRRDLLKTVGAGSILGLFAVGKASGNATFARSTYETARGDIAQIGIDSATNQNVLVVVGDSEHSGYEAEVEIDPGGGPFTLSMNTYLAAGVGNGPTFSIDGGSASIVDQRLLTRELDQILAEGRYELAVEIDGTVVDLATLTLTEPERGAQALWTAPHEVDLHREIDSQDDLARLANRGQLTSTTKIAVGDADSRSTEIDEAEPLGDWLVYEVELSGVFGLVEAEGYNTVAEMADDGYLDLPIQRQDGGELDESSREHITVYSDPANETLFFVAKTDDLAVRVPQGVRRFSRLVGDRFDATFQIDHSFIDLFTRATVTEDDNERATEPFDLVDRELTFDTTNGVVRAEAEPNHRVAGETTVAPGTTFEVRAISRGQGAFLEDDETTVVSDGSFSVGLDLSDQPDGNEFTLTVPDQGFENDAETTGVIGATEPAFVEVSDLDPADGTIEQGETLEITALITNTGSEETATDVVLSVEGTTIDVQQVTLEGSESRDVSFGGQFDTSRLPSGEYAYTVATDDDSGEGRLTIESESPTTEDAAFEVSTLEPGDSTVEDNTPVTITATIRNTGETRETRDVVLVVEGAIVEGEPLTLDGGESETVSFEIPPPPESDQTYTYAVETGDDSQSGTLTVAAAPSGEAIFEVQAIEPETGTVTAGETIDVDVTVENTGDGGGTQDVTLTAAEDVQSREVSLDPGEAETVTFTVDTSDQDGTLQPVAATYDDETLTASPVEIRSQDETGDDADSADADDDTADESDDDTVDGSDDDSTDETEDDDSFIEENLFLIGGGGAAAVGAALYGLMKRSDDGNDGQPGPAGATHTDEQPSGSQPAAGSTGYQPHGGRTAAGPETDGTVDHSEWRPDDVAGSGAQGGVPAEQNEWQPDEPTSQPPAGGSYGPPPGQPPADNYQNQPPNQPPTDEPQGHPPRDQPPADGLRGPQPREEPPAEGYQSQPPRDGRQGAPPRPEDSGVDTPDGHDNQPRQGGTRPPRHGQQDPPREPRDPTGSPPPRGNDPVDHGGQPYDKPADHGGQPYDKPAGHGGQPYDEPVDHGTQPPRRDDTPGQQPPPRNESVDPGPSNGHPQTEPEDEPIGGERERREGSRRDEPGRRGDSTEERDDDR